MSAVSARRRARAAGRGSAPGSSRRAPSSARRRSGASACTRAPSRSSRAAASRPRTGAGSPSAAPSRSGSRPGRAARPARVAAPLVQPEVRLERLADLAPDRQHRVQARHRVLEDHRDLAAADPAQLASRRARSGRGPRTSRVPLRHRAGSRARIPSSASEVTLLPQPDSPTIPSVSPGAISNETPLTACTVPRVVLNRTRRSVDGEQRLGLRHGLAASGRAPRAGRRRSG